MLLPAGAVLAVFAVVLVLPPKLDFANQEAVELQIAVSAVILNL